MACGTTHPVWSIFTQALSPTSGGEPPEYDLRDVLAALATLEDALDGDDRCPVCRNTAEAIREGVPITPREAAGLMACVYSALERRGVGNPIPERVRVPFHRARVNEGDTDTAGAGGSGDKACWSRQADSCPGRRW